MPDKIDAVVPASDGELLDDEKKDENLDESLTDDELLAGNEEEEEKGEKKEKSDEELEEDEDEEKEEKKEKKDDEDEDLGPRRPTFSEIKGKYPNLFKDFPDLREAFFRESEYTKVFPTVEDAREAVEDLEILSVIRDKVLEGDFTAILESAKEADARSYTKLVRNMLPALYKMDQDAFTQAITPSIENLLRSALKEGRANSNEDLENSARHISQWFFGTDDVALGKTTTVKKADESSPEELKFQKERQDFESRKYNEAYTSVVTDRDSAMERVVLKGLDEDNELSQYVKTKLVHDVIEEIDKALAKDKAHMSLMNSKWRRAKVEGYSRDSLKSIVSAYQARAKSLVPSVRSRLKSSALGKTGEVKKARRAEENESNARKELLPGRPSNSKGRLPRPSEIDWRSTSDADILDGNIKTRK